MVAAVFGLVKMLTHNCAFVNPTTSQIDQANLLRRICGELALEFFPPQPTDARIAVATRRDLRTPLVTVSQARRKQIEQRKSAQAARFAKEKELRTARAEKSGRASTKKCKETKKRTVFTAKRK